MYQVCLAQRLELHAIPGDITTRMAESTPPRDPEVLVAASKGMSWLDESNFVSIEGSPPPQTVMQGIFDQTMNGFRAVQSELGAMMGDFGKHLVRTGVESLLMNGVKAAGSLMVKPLSPEARLQEENEILLRQGRRKVLQPNGRLTVCRIDDPVPQGWTLV
jgi:hypothetical protein